MTKLTGRLLRGLKLALSSLNIAVTGKLKYASILNDKQEDVNKKMELLKRILLVDDDEVTKFLSLRIFKKAGINAEILPANHGLEALDIVKEAYRRAQSLALILLDIKMPVMDGFEFLEKVTRLPDLNLSQTKIYMCTSSQHPKDKEQAYLYPIAGFLTKPLTLKIFKEILG